jgi:hypothetical protein
VEPTKQKEGQRKKPKPEEQEGMPQRRHCPPVPEYSIATFEYFHKQFNKK